MTYRIASTRDRLRSAGGAALLVAAIGYGLVAGLGVDVRAKIDEQLKIVALLPDTPPPRPDPVWQKQAEKRKEGAASPPNLKSKATEIVAPVPPVVLPQPTPVVVAPVAGLGSDRSAGAAPFAGPGTGSGGQGIGLGSGDGGDGDGGGGTDAELVSNKLHYTDLPHDVWDSHAAGLVTYRATIGVNGRLSDCRIVRTSGNAALDTATCALALRHVRFRPARDARGRKVTDTAIFEQEWTVDRREGAEPDDR